MTPFAAPCMLLKLIICQLFIISASCSVLAFALSPSSLAQADMSSATGEGGKPGRGA